MSLITATIAAAASYIINEIKNSKGGKKASDEMSIAIWDWVKPVFLKEGKEKLVDKLENDKNEEEYLKTIELALEEIVESNESFKNRLEKEIKEIAKSDSGIGVKIRTILGNITSEIDSQKTNRLRIVLKTIFGSVKSKVNHEGK